MKIPLTVLVFFFSLFIASYQEVQAAAPPLTKVIMTSGSASERDGVVYVAQDQGFFRKYGLDLSFVQVRNGFCRRVYQPAVGYVRDESKNQKSHGVEGEKCWGEQLERRWVDFFDVDAGLLGTGAGAGQNTIPVARRTGGDGARNIKRHGGRRVLRLYVR